MTATRTYLGQVYHAVGSEPYTRRDGTLTTLLVWRSRCATCDAEFEIKTPTESAKFSPNRRCVRHKRPGIRVGGQRRSGGGAA